MTKMTGHEKILPISQDKDILMNFPFVTEKLRPWFYENYVNMLIYGDTGQAIAFTDSIGFFNVPMKQVMGQTYAYRNEQIDSKEYLTELLRRHFDDDFYCFIWVDEYFIPDSTKYEKWHFVHPFFAYGYDLEAGAIYTAQINSDTGMILRKVKTDDLYTAVKETMNYYKIGDPYKWSLTETVKFFKSEYDVPRPFCLDKFLANFEDYIFSRPNVMNRDFLYISVPNPGTCFYGLQIYDALIDAVKNLSHNYDTIAYPSFHIFVQGKKNIIERLRYVHGLHQVGEDFGGLIREYEEKVYRKLLKMTALNLKYNVIEKRQSNTFNADPVFIEKLTHALRETKEAEKDILFDVYRQLVGYKRDNFYKGDCYAKEYGDFVCEYPDSRSVKVVLGEPQYITDIKILSADDRIPIGSFEFPGGKKIITRESDISLSEKIHDIYAEKVGEFIYTSEEADIDVSALKFRLMANSGNSHWDFSGADRYIHHKWQTNTEISIISMENGRYTIKGADSTLTCGGICINLDKSKYAYIKYSTSCTSENAQLFFATYGYPALSEDKSKVFTISPDDRAFEYIVDMSDNEKWCGAAKQLRFDPVSYDNTSVEGECTVEYIEISDRLPTYGSDRDYMKTQGVNGWSYLTYNNGITYREMAWDGENGRWAAKNDRDIIITQTAQTSKSHIGTVRRWTCPAEGKYSVKYRFNQIAENGMPDRERLSHFVLRRNHKIIEKAMYDYNIGALAGSGETVLILETGEALNFEFYNGSEHTMETLEIDVAIKKHDS